MIVVLHLLNQDASGGPVELAFLVVSTVVVVGLHVALLRMFQDVKPEKTKRQPSAIEMFRHDLRAARRARNH